MAAPIADRDPLDVRLAATEQPLLSEFNAAGVLSPADVHVATRVAALAGETAAPVILALALAVRGPRLGHVFTDLATIRETATVDTEEPIDLSTLPWPGPADWPEAVAASPLTATGEDLDESLPLRLVGSHVYLDRYWREEVRLAADLGTFAGDAPAGVDEAALREGLARLFPREADAAQRAAAEAAVQRRFAVVAGGPGTGKTTTVARIAALLLEQAAATGSPAPLLALAAPTGKAAARLKEAVHEQAESMPASPEIKAALSELDATTLHRLLGWRPGSHSRFRHDRLNRLPHDVVIVDETSMVGLSLMGRLVEAVRPDARLILVGDAGQLTSVEAGAVLGDVVGPATEIPAAPDSPIAAGIVVLDRVHRFGGAIADLATAIRRGDADSTLEVLASSADDVTWLEVDAAAPEAADALAPIAAGAVAAGRAVIEAARDRHAREALDALRAFRLLCAHRRGPYGAATWGTRVESWLAAATPDFAAGGRWYVGRPLLVTENDYGLRLFNGDTGVVVATGDEDGRVVAAIDRAGEVVDVSPSRLAAVDTVYAMTVHKAQGSQFDTATVLLPDPSSPILTRELLYTAVSRARTRVIVAGTEEAIRTAVERPVARASGLRRRLWQ